MLAFVAACFLLVLAGALRSAKDHKIEIRHVGPPAVSDDLIRANIRVKVGDTYTRDRRSMRMSAPSMRPACFTTSGWSRSAIADGDRPDLRPSRQTGLTDISFEGNKKYKNTKLLKKVTPKSASPWMNASFSPTARKYRRCIKRPATKRPWSSTAPRSTRTPGAARSPSRSPKRPKVKIERVDFVGAEAFPQKKLRKVIKTRRHWMFSWMTGSRCAQG